MSGESNPYAPPGAADPGTSTTRQWQLDGVSVFARNRAILPKVDLDTGEHDAPMKPIHLASPTKSPLATVASAVLTAIFVFCAVVFDFNPLMMVVPVITMIIGWRLVALRTGSDGKMVAWAFMSETRADRLNRRRKIRARLLFGCAIGYLWVALGDFASVPPVLMLACFAGIFGCAIWGLIDRPKVRATAVDGGWLHLAPIHPQALEFLRAEQDRLSAVESTARKRLVRTTWLHRYPLRLLTGQTRHPLILLRIVLMKFLRSKLLVRESYHYSEAEKRHPSGLCAPLQLAMNAWLENHPDWQFIDAEHLPCPGGDLMVQSAILASPGLEHTLSITRAWMEQAADRAVNHHHFMTRLEDGATVRTHDQPFLDLQLPGFTERGARGEPEAVYQNHLASLGGRMPAAAGSRAALLERIEQLKAAFDQALTAAGYQSEARETAAG